MTAGVLRRDKDLCVIHVACIKAMAADSGGTLETTSIYHHKAMTSSEVDKLGLLRGF